MSGRPEPTLHILGPGPRRRGRPKASEPSSSVSTRVPVSVHERLVKAAAASRLTVSGYIARVLAREARD